MTLARLHDWHAEEEELYFDHTSMAAPRRQTGMSRQAAQRSRSTTRRRTWDGAEDAGAAGAQGGAVSKRQKLKEGLSSIFGKATKKEQ